MSQTDLVYLDSDLVKVLFREVLDTDIGLEREKELFGYFFHGSAILEPPFTALYIDALPNAELSLPGELQSQPMDQLLVLKPVWKFLDETEEEKQQRQPQEPQDSYVDTQYAILDMILD